MDGFRLRSRRQRCNVALNLSNVMQRTITGFEQDEEGHWVALLSCGQRQHMRHKPPFIERPWVVVAQSRNARIGTTIECPLCLQPDNRQPADKGGA